MDNEHIRNVEKKGLISLSIIVFTLLLIPPVHELTHALNCFENGGNVAEVKYWSHVICDEKVKDENIVKMNSFDILNDKVTAGVFFSLLLPSLALGFHSSFVLLRHYMKYGRTY